MDHILGNKAVFKSTTDTVGQCGVDRRAGDRGGRATTARRSRWAWASRWPGWSARWFPAATVPAADTRTWDNLPRYLSFASVPLPLGQHVATVQFLDAAGRVSCRT